MAWMGLASLGVVGCQSSEPILGIYTRPQSRFRANFGHLPSPSLAFTSQARQGYRRNGLMEARGWRQPPAARLTPDTTAAPIHCDITYFDGFSKNIAQHNLVKESAGIRAIPGTLIGQRMRVRRSRDRWNAGWRVPGTGRTYWMKRFVGSAWASPIGLGWAGRPRAGTPCASCSSDRPCGIFPFQGSRIWCPRPWRHRPLSVCRRLHQGLAHVRGRSLHIQDDPHPHLPCSFFNVPVLTAVEPPALHRSPRSGSSLGTTSTISSPYPAVAVAGGSDSSTTP